jgi:hypothetical protein
MPGKPEGGGMDRFRRTYHRLRLGSNTGDGGVAAAHPSQDALPKSSVEEMELRSDHRNGKRRGEVRLKEAFFKVF